MFTLKNACLLGLTGAAMGAAGGILMAVSTRMQLLDAVRIVLCIGFNLVGLALLIAAATTFIGAGLAPGPGGQVLRRPSG